MNRARERPDLRLAILVLQVVLALPATAMLAVAALALLLLMTRTVQPEYGFGAVLMISGGMIVLFPFLWYVWSVRRWWSGRGWKPLLASDIALVTLSAALVVTDYVPGWPVFAAEYGAFAGLAAVLLVRSNPASAA